MAYNKKAVLVAGGTINEGLIENIIKEIQTADYTIAIDKGLELFYKCNLMPDAIIGDFDSIQKEIIEKYKNKTSIYKLNTEKDYTDTHMGIKLAVENKCDNVVIYGAIGTRMDHVLGNIHILKELIELGISAKIIDANNEITLIKNNTYIEKSENYKYISFIPLTTQVEGVSLKGFKYNIENRNINIGESIGISNEQLEDKAEIRIKKGTLIMIKSKD